MSQWLVKILQAFDLAGIGNGHPAYHVPTFGG
jgi:hypothetical protein